MSIKLGSNIASMTAQRRLGEASSSLATLYEKLSSGQRINRASDDSAGLAIADELKAKSRIYTQGIRNANDGISLLNIADSAIDALSGVVIRIRELSEQSANGTYSNKQREALDNEAQQLSKEFTRITQTTTFNGIKLFDGSLGQGVRLQMGVGLSESIKASIGGAIGTGSFTTQFTTASNLTSPQEIKLADLNSDGIMDIVSSGTNYFSVNLGKADGSFYAGTVYSTGLFWGSDIEIGDLNGDGILDIVAAGTTNSGFYRGQVRIRLGNGDGSFSSSTSLSMNSGSTNAVELADINSDGFLDILTAGSDGSFYPQAQTGVRLGLGDGTFSALSNFLNEPMLGDSSSSYGLTTGDINGDGILDLVTTGISDTVYYEDFGNSTLRLGKGDGTFHSASYYTTGTQSSYSIELSDLNSDGYLDMITGDAGQAVVRLGQGDGSFGVNTIYSLEGAGDLSVADLNGDGIKDLVAVGLNKIVTKLGLGDGSFGNNIISSNILGAGGLAVADLNSDGVLDTLNLNYTANNISINYASTMQGLGAMLEFSLKTRKDSLQAIGILDKTLENLAKQRGTIGASQSRVNIAISNLQTARENFSAAESRIRDADVAGEAANLIRTQILQQTAASVLSQANQQPQLVLQLLR